MAEGDALRPFSRSTAAFLESAQSPRDYLEGCLARIEAREAEVRAFVTLNVEGARKAADEASARYRAGTPLSPIDGMPIGIKDVIETRDMPTQMGSPVYEGWHSGRDAACVRALRDAGAVILGKTVTCEFAGPFPGPTRNPLDTSRTPGGSNSGSGAAVGAGMIPAALGTQVVGSIIRPASYCGAYGFKPTLGALNRGGCHDYMSQSCLGVIAASLTDSWLVAHNIARRVGGDPGTPGLYGDAGVPESAPLRRVIRLETRGWEKADGEAKQTLEHYLARLRDARVEVVSRRDWPEIEAFEAAIDRAGELSRTINSWEIRWPLNDYRDRGLGLLSPILEGVLETVESMTLDDYRAATAERERLRKRYSALADRADGFLTLGATGPAPVGLEHTGNPAFNLPASVLGVPALTLPLMTIQGLPVGLQLIGLAERDAALFAYAGWLHDLLAGA